MFKKLRIFFFVLNLEALPEKLFTWHIEQPASCGLDTSSSIVLANRETAIAHCISPKISKVPDVFHGIMQSLNSVCAHKD